MIEIIFKRNGTVYRDRVPQVTELEWTLYNPRNELMTIYKDCNGKIAGGGIMKSEYIDHIIKAD